MNWIRALLNATLLAIGGSQFAHAQDAATVEQLVRQILSKQMGTISVKAIPLFAEGSLTGCQLEYGAIAKDHAYRQGGFIRVTGTIGLLSTATQPVVSLKVLLEDIEPRTLAFTPSVPASAYYIDGSTTTKGAILGSQPSDTGGLFVVFKLSPTFEAIARGLGQGQVTIAFARKTGGLDIVLPIETVVVDTADTGERNRSKKMTTDFFDCSRIILKRFVN